MKRSTIVLLSVAMIASAANARAAMLTYAIVDQPAYQTDTTVTGVTDHVWGTILADPTTGQISSATFTIEKDSGATYTVANATISDGNANTGFPMVSVTGTQISINNDNPGGALHLVGSTNVPGVSAMLDWTFGLYPATTNYDNSYAGTVYPNVGKGAVANWQTQFGFGALPSSDFPWVIATVVPEPSTLVLLGIGAASLLAYAWRRRRS